MARHPRYWKTDTYYHISNRCLEARYFLKPSKAVNQIVLGCLLRYAEKFQIEIVCFVFMSNHYHLIARAPYGNMSAFMANFQRELSKRVNELRLRTGCFWARRYSAEPILSGDDKALQEKIAYVLNNPVRAGLVDHVQNWAGVSSWEFHQTGAAAEGTFLNNTKLARLRRRDSNVDSSAALEKHTVQLTVPGCFDGESDSEANRLALLELIEREREVLVKTTHPDGKEPASTWTSSRDWNYRPENPSRRPRPLCHTSSAELRRAFRTERFEVTNAYQRAMCKLRSLKAKKVEFPEGTLPPGWSRCVGAPVLKQRKPNSSQTAGTTTSQESHAPNQTEL